MKKKRKQGNHGCVCVEGKLWENDGLATLMKYLKKLRKHQQKLEDFLLGQTRPKITGLVSQRGRYNALEISENKRYLFVIQEAKYDKTF